MKYQIENMTCGGCAKSVTNVIRTVDPGAQVLADVAAGTVEIISPKGGEAFVAVLANAGFPIKSAA